MTNVKMLPTERHYTQIIQGIIQMKNKLIMLLSHQWIVTIQSCNYADTT